MSGTVSSVARCGTLLAVVVCGCVWPIPQGDPVPKRADGLKIELNRDSEPRASFDVVGLSEADLAAIEQLADIDKASLFEVYVASDAIDPPPMTGEVTVIDSRLRFTPRYPLQGGLRYRAVLRRARLPNENPAAEDVAAEFAIPQPPKQQPTVVAQIYPTADRLPENLLKFYIHFSAPMSRGEAYRRIHLLDAEGNEVANPFLELGEELWDPDMRRFTLLFDPGRIKRGLKPREEVGPVLEEGKRYTLVVDRDWLDAGGQPLAQTHTKPFESLPPDDVPVDAAAWTIEPPQAGSRDPLVVRLPEPLDHALFARVMQVVDSSGQAVTGSIEITDGEACWRFTPDKPWSAGGYQLVADTTLEDLAGNSIGRAFDVDVFAPIQKQITTETISLPFTTSGP